MDARARRALTEARAGPRWGAGVGGAGREVALGARGRRGDSGALAAHVKPHFRRRGGLSEGDQLTKIYRLASHLLAVGALDAEEQGLGALGVGVGAVA